MSTETSYYVPAQSKWPIIATIGLALTLFGAASIMNASTAGEETGGSWLIFLAGSLIMAYMLFGWFGNVIQESRAGMYSGQMDRSFRWGMSWFIFSESDVFCRLLWGAFLCPRILCTLVRW